MSPVSLAGALAQQNAEALFLVALVPDRPARRADGLRRVHLERRHADRRAGVRDARSRSRARSPAARWRGATGCRGGRPTRPPRTSSTPRPPTRSEMAVWGAIMGGVNLLYQGAGWLEGGLTASFEKLIVDAEILQMMSEVLQPLAVDDAEPRASTPSPTSGPGGHFFGDRPHPRALRDRVLPAARLRLAQLRDVAGRRRADRDASARTRSGSGCWPRPCRRRSTRRSPRRSTRSSPGASARSPARRLTFR